MRTPIKLAHSISDIIATNISRYYHWQDVPINIEHKMTPPPHPFLLLTTLLLHLLTSAAGLLSSERERERERERESIYIFSRETYTWWGPVNKIFIRILS